MLALFLALAYADAPTDVVASVSAGSSLPERFDVSPDQQWVSFLSGSTAYLLDVGSWELHPVACTATAATVDDGALYVACSGTDVHRYELVHGSLVDRGAEWTSEASIEGLWAYDDELFVVREATSASEFLRVSNGTAASTTAVIAGVSEGQLVGNRLYIWHGADDISTVTLPTGVPTSAVAVATGTFDDVAVSFNNTAYGVIGDQGTVAELVGTSFQIALAGLSSPTALATSEDTSDPWAVVATSAGLEVRDAASGIGGVVRTLTPTGTVRDIRVVDGYALLGNSGGQLDIATAAPWVEASVTPEEAEDGDQVDLSFVVDRDATYRVVLDGSQISSGSALSGQAVTLPITVDSRFAEGSTGIWVYATASGVEGHDRADVVVDSPPPAPTLSVGFGESSLHVTVSGVDDEDLDHYVIYASTESFSADDYATGGPADFDSTDELVLPIEVSANPGEAVEVTLSPLTNGVSYTIGARAVDAGGQEGPMSRTQTGTPEEVYSAAELANESGGVSCATTQGPGWLFLGGLFGLLGRRRSVVAAGLLVASTASAQDSTIERDKPKGVEKLCAGWKDIFHPGQRGTDMTPTCADFEIRYGSRTIEDADIQSVYGSNAHGILMFEAGPQIHRLVELDLGFGLYRKFDRAVSSDGLSSDVDTMLTLWPLSLSGTFRLQLMDEQLLVPFVRGGLDYVMFGERWDDGAGGRDFVKGAKLGNHWGAGVNLLLDPFAPGRASLLEAQTGINDTFITIEYRRTTVNPGEGFDLSGSNVSVGLKLDY
ncbi:MAG: hypothetical protein EP330_29580 [Deltaproteobacteria bacterium]|nr:MAG: hypothetical protein EP330_29580 [Deltaproteobacteria bacterium]